MAKARRRKRTRGVPSAIRTRIKTDVKISFGTWLNVQHSRTRTRLKLLTRKAKAGRNELPASGHRPEPIHAAGVATTFYASGCILHLAELSEHAHTLLPILVLAGLAAPVS